jgi:TDG/mug DNA glycosylase family protein
MPSDKPNKDQIQRAAGKSVPEIIAPGLRILFCGINPGLYSGAVGHHFARPGNRFWPVLHAAGFTPRRLEPADERELLDLGYGITNFVNYATASANELSREQLIAGGRQLEQKVRHYQPQYLAILGIGAYQTAYQRLKARLGRQFESIADTIVWVLPNPSGLNAHYQFQDLVDLFGELRQATLND